MANTCFRGKAWSLPRNIGLDPRDAICHFCCAPMRVVLNLSRLSRCQATFKRLSRKLRFICSLPIYVRLIDHRCCLFCWINWGFSREPDASNLWPNPGWIYLLHLSAVHGLQVVDDLVWWHVFHLEKHVAFDIASLLLLILTNRDVLDGSLVVAVLHSFHPVM